MTRDGVARLTYREMWETYVEPNLKAQEEVRQRASGERVDPFGSPDRPVTVEDKVRECQAAALMFGVDPIEAGKIARQSWPIKPDDIKRIRERLAARSGRNKK